MEHNTVQQDPFADDANWSESAVQAPLLNESRPSRPSTPRRSTSTRSVNSRSPQNKSGIVFGTPRTKRRLSNPFSDLQAGQHASSPESLSPTAPARSLVYSRRVPDESEYAMLQHAHATPGNAEEEEELDEKYDAGIGIRAAEDEESMHQKTERDYLKGGKQFGQSILSFFPRKQYIPMHDKSARPVLQRFRNMFILVLVGVVLVSTAFVLSVLNSKQPSVHWKGTLSDSTGALESTGFNFTRHIDLGFTSPNLFPMELAKVSVWAAYLDTHYFGLSSNEHVGLTIPGMNRRNASLPFEMEFAYVSSQDPDNYMLETLIKECGDTGMLAFDLIVEAKVEAIKVIPYTVDFARLAASMTCDNNMMVLAQEMLVKAQAS